MGVGARLVGLVVASVLLAACGMGPAPGAGAAAEEGPPAASPVPTTEPSGPGATPTPSATTDSDAGTGDTACVTGNWRLDIADYQAQAARWLKGLGIPLSRLRIKGSQSLAFNPGYLSVGTDLTVVARVAGRSISAHTEYAGGGEWFWNATAPDVFEVENWATTVDDADTPRDVPAVPLFDVTSGGIKVRCDGDRLVLRGAGAPLVGRFTRVP